MVRLNKTQRIGIQKKKTKTENLLRHLSDAELNKSTHLTNWNHILPIIYQKASNGKSQHCGHSAPSCICLLLLPGIVSRNHRFVGQTG